ncbi:MAG: type II secretion system protein, partial [Candidatus Hydrogenedentes bacterium]|nr:type II secretion system protein [Candidatus Hydrogenedentota bacterium]
MSRVQRRGFTLIELLTVIAIIAILAGLTMTVLPRMREKAKITKIKGTMANLNTALTNYFATNNSYPPAYGYRQPSSRGESPVPGQEDTYYFLKPYPTFIRYSLGDTEDIFSNGYSTDGNASLGILEFLPLGTKDVATNSVAFPMERFDGTNLAGEVSA